MITTTESNIDGFTLRQLYRVSQSETIYRIFNSYLMGEELQRPIYEGTLSEELQFMDRIVEDIHILSTGIVEIELAE